MELLTGQSRELSQVRCYFKKTSALVIYLRVAETIFPLKTTLRSCGLSQLSPHQSLSRQLDKVRSQWVPGKVHIEQNGGAKGIIFSRLFLGRRAEVFV